MNFKPGDKVRFRLGEREVVKMECCGAEIDEWQSLVDFGLTGGMFEVMPNSNIHCVRCLAPTSRHAPITLAIPNKITIGGHLVVGFQVYPEELPLVDAAEPTVIN